MMCLAILCGVEMFCAIRCCATLCRAVPLKPLPTAGFCLQCVDKMKSNFGQDDIRVGVALHNMAGLYLSIKPPEFERAEHILREALDVSPRELHSEQQTRLAPCASITRQA